MRMETCAVKDAAEKSAEVALTYPRRGVVANLSEGKPCPLFIGVGGGSSCGKKQVCEMIMKSLLSRKLQGEVIIIRMNDFYRQLTSHQLELASKGDYNFDHPDAFDFDLLEECVSKIIKNESVVIPSYDFSNHIRTTTDAPIEPFSCKIVILEGIFILYKKSLRDILSLKVFVDMDSDDRLTRMIIRDTKQRHQRPLERVLRQYVKFVKPSFEDFILPSKKYADVIIPRGSENGVAIDLLASHVLDILQERSCDSTTSSRDTKSLQGLRIRAQSTGILSDEEEQDYNEMPN